MKKLIYLYILIFLSCEPSWFGLEEDLGIYSYHDGLALAWETFFSEQDYDTAISYLNSTINETEDEIYYNSAYTALGWLYLFKSNIFIGESPDSITVYRDRAFTKLSYIEKEEDAIEEYNTGCYYDFCCPDCFAKDRELGLLYMQIEEYFIFPDTTTTNIIALISQLASFVNDNDGLDNNGLEVDDEVEYNFMNGKPIGNNGETMDFAIDDVRVYLARIYFRNGQFEDSCTELTALPDYNGCVTCVSDDAWDNNNLDDLLECFNSQTLF